MEEKIATVTMAFTRLGKLASLLLCFLTPGSALAVNLVTNGSFETGTTAGWTVSSGTCTWQSLLAGGVTSQAGGWTAPTPTDGTRVLLSDATEPGTCTFQQDVSIPAGTTDTLTLDAGYNYHNFLDSAGGGCSASVAVTTTTNAPIATAYSATGGINQSLAPQPPVDLTAQAGSTVRILVTTTSCFGGPAGVILDNVVLDSVGATTSSAAPVMSRTGLVIVVILLAAVGMLQLVHRRVTH
jgi:hypothetical protein